MGGWRLALCRVPRGAKRGYGRIRTDTDINGQVRTINLLEYCGKPDHHKPRKRRYTQNYLSPVRLFSRTTGAHPNRRQAEPTTTSRLLGDSPTTGARASGLRSGALSRRYPRVLSRRRRGRGLTSSTEPTSEDKARPGKARTRRYIFTLKLRGT